MGPAGVPGLVWRLGWVSLLADLASELAYPLVPLFLTATLGASPAVVGLIEGLAEGTAAGLRGVAGALSDRLARRRPLVSLGYGLAAIGRALLPLAPAWGVVLAARLIDRTGKGVRGAPRDAMIADVVTPATRGRAYGLHRAMDTSGAVLGPLAALALLAAIGSGHLREILLVSALPACAAVALTFTVREPRRPLRAPSAARGGTVRALPGPYWRALAGWSVFCLGNSTDAFLILRADERLDSTTGAVALYVLLNVVAASGALPAGILSDRLGRRGLLVGGLVVFAGAYAILAADPGAAALAAAFALYGGYAAMTDGVSRAFVVDAVPAGARGAGLGVFQAVTAGATVLASVVGGVLWSALGPGWTFAYGAAAALLWAALLAGATRPARRPSPAAVTPAAG